MTDADISEQAAKAAMECNELGHDVGEYMCGACAIVLGRRLIAIGRAEAFREVLELSNNRVLNDWLRRSLSDEEERAKS